MQSNYYNSLSLKTKMALSVTSVFILFIIAASCLTLSYLERTFKESISTQQFFLVSSLAVTIDDKLSIAQNALIAVASTVPRDTLKNADQAQHFLNTITGFHSIFDNNISFISTEGKLIAESRYLPGRRGKDLSYREFVKKTVASQKPYISAPYISTHIPVHPAIMMTVPIFDRRGNLAGMLSGSIDLLGKNFLADLSKKTIGKSGYLFMTDSNRTVIAYPDKGRIMKLSAPPGANKLYDQVVNGLEGSGETVNTRGIPVISSYKRMSMTSWILGSSYPISEAYSPLYQAKLYFGITAVVATVMLLSITWFIMRRLLTPLAVITRHVKLLPENPVQERHIVIDSADEIGMLSTAFNTMIDTLDRQQDALKDQKNKIEDERAFLQTMMDAIPDTIFYKDRNSIYQGCNGSFASLFVGQPKDKLIGRSDYDFALTAEHAKLFQRSDQEVISSGGPDRQDVLIRLIDGRQILLDTLKVPFRDAQGNIKGIIGISRDITQRKRMEDELRVLNMELEQRVTERTADLQRLNNELKSFCYSISHELRAPIARLLGFSRIMAETAARAEPEELSYLAERIGDASLRLRSVIDSLLLMNRLSRAEIRKEQVNLSELAARTAKELVEETPGRSVNIRIAPDIEVYGDRSMLTICIQNLMQNAFKYTGKRVEAEIEFARTEVSGEKVFFVRDNGAGFDMKFADQLFEPFCRLHGEEEFEGSGMGLPTVQRIIERHGGRIWAEAHEGKGATFYFTFGG